jgi:hypothetical protein
VFLAHICYFIQWFPEYNSVMWLRDCRVLRKMSEELNDKRLSFSTTVTKSVGTVVWQRTGFKHVTGKQELRLVSCVSDSSCLEFTWIRFNSQSKLAQKVHCRSNLRSPRIWMKVKLFDCSEFHRVFSEFECTFLKSSWKMKQLLLFFLIYTHTGQVSFLYVQA